MDKDPIGDGTYSICMKCESLIDGQHYAVKIVNASHDVTKEIEMLQKCKDNSNIVKLIEVLKDQAYTYIVMELLGGGELFERIRKCTRFTEQEACHYFTQIVRAVAFMHSNGVAHRDLKPENILFLKSDSSVLKVVDFGFATETNNSMNTPCFTLGYAAPEMLFGNGSTYTEACDLWSLGVILYTMLCGQTPFLPKIENRERHDKYINDMASRIARGSFDTDTDHWSLVSESAKNLVNGLLTVNVKNRFSMKQVLDHSWLHNSCPRSASLATPALHTPFNQHMFVNEVKDTYDAFTHAQKLGFRLQEVGNAKLAQRRRHKKSHSISRSSDESSTSELGRSKSSSVVVTSDPNCRSISSGVATASSDAEYKSTGRNAPNNALSIKSVSSDLVICISDDEDEFMQPIKKSRLETRFDSTKSEFDGFSDNEIENNKQVVDKFNSIVNKPKRGRKRKLVQEVTTPVIDRITRSRVRTRRNSFSGDKDDDLTENLPIQSKQEPSRKNTRGRSKKKK